MKWRTNNLRQYDRFYLTGSARSDRPPSVMKMSITAGGVKSSINHPNGEDLNIYELVEQVVTPLLITAGFSQETIAAGFTGSPEPVREDGPRVRLPDVPEGFAFVGHFDGPYDPSFSSEDLVYLGGYDWEEWESCTTFGGRHPYAARIGSPAHAFALENFPPQS